MHCHSSRPEELCALDEHFLFVRLVLSPIADVHTRSRVAGKGRTYLQATATHAGHLPRGCANHCLTQTSPRHWLDSLQGIFFASQIEPPCFINRRTSTADKRARWTTRAETITPNCYVCRLPQPEGVRADASIPCLTLVLNQALQTTSHHALFVPVYLFLIRQQTSRPRCRSTECSGHVTYCCRPGTYE